MADRIETYQLVRLPGETLRMPVWQVIPMYLHLVASF